MIRFALIATLVLGFSTDALATSNGCGIGWAFSKRRSLLSSSLRASTNSTLPGPFGYTSGTSGCKKHKILQKEQQEKMFLADNYDQVLEELAQRNGEHLATLGLSWGCGVQEQDRWINQAADRFDQVVPPSANPQALYYNLKALAHCS